MGLNKSYGHVARWMTPGARLSLHILRAYWRRKMSDGNRDELGTYLTAAEAKEFHKLFVLSMGFFTFVAIVAHILMWAWRPWFPGTPGYEATKAAATHVVAPVGAPPAAKA
jgi:light-harvesting complex 1 beta chain